jgi:imidazolonepropionase-like amidohydrolase
MEPVRRPTTLVGVLTALVLAHPDAAFGQELPPRGREIALVGGLVFPSPAQEPLPNGVVLVRDGVVVDVGSRESVPLPRGAEVIDCSGRAVTAGFWNSHVHFMERKWANAAEIPAAELAEQVEDMLGRYGFTSVFDTGSPWDNTRRLRDRIEAGELPGPRIRSTGEIILPKGGRPPDLVFDVTGRMHMRLPEVATPDEAREAARAHLDAGTDAVKLYAATWAPPIVAIPEGAIRAVADEAHRRGKLVFAHPSNREGLLNAVRGGVDVVVHTAPSSGPWDEGVLGPMKRAGVALVPTLKLWTHELRHDRTSSREAFAAAGIAQLRAWVGAGGAVLFGTDVGYMDDYDPGDEYALMAKAQMTARQILASLTTAPSERFGESARRGRIAPGQAADLVVLDRDPSHDVRAFGAVRYAIREGRVVYRAKP